MTELTVDEEKRIMTLVFLASRHASRTIGMFSHLAMLSRSTWQEANEYIAEMRDDKRFINLGVARVEESLGKLGEYEIEIYHDIFVSEINVHLDFIKGSVEKPLKEEFELSSHLVPSSNPNPLGDLFERS